MGLQFMPAGTSDALTLTGLSKRAFETDVLVGGPSKGGPPGYMVRLAAHVSNGLKSRIRPVVGRI